MSIECRRLDKLKEAITNSDYAHATLAYCMKLSHAFVNRREYRNEGVANILEKLLRSENKDEPLMAYQFAFDLNEYECKAFMLSVRDHLSIPKLNLEQPIVTETDTQMSECDPAEVTFAERSDLLILKTIKMRDSVCHSGATVYANALIHAGTTVNIFLRENLQGRSLMAPYLPKNGSGFGGSPYSEGGALYALGLIHANHGEGIKQFLRDSLHSTSDDEVVQHGSACLGLGLAALGTADEGIYHELKTVLYTDSAVAGEAAAISMGLLMVGTPRLRVIRQQKCLCMLTRHNMKRS
ncbi:26S proteasome non-ATPase regulatory subunit 1 homolog A-like protein [Tanacetum coccineum]